MEPLITTELVALDADLGASPPDVIRALAERLGAAGRATDVDGLVDDALEREGKAATGLPGGIAIPHCRSAHVTTGSLGFARLDPTVEFGASDGPADLVFLIAAPAEGDADHMKLLTALARALVREEFTTALRAAETDQEIVDLVRDVVSPQEAATSDQSGAEASAGSATTTDDGGEATAAAAAGAGAATATAERARRIVAVTACPTGIAHTYMAADKLEQAARDAGVELLVETQGSSGSTPLTADDIRNADAAIFAADVGVRDRGRFAGLPVIQSGVKRAINEPDVMVTEALAAADNPNAQRVEGDADAGGGEAEGEGAGTKLRKWLMTGVSYMIPFVAAGGLLIALGFLIGGYDIVSAPEGSDVARNVTFTTENSLWNLPDAGLAAYLGAVLSRLGQLAFAFLVPALAGYIAYAIADRPGIAPGFVVGQVAVVVGGGFLGGLIGGLLAGGAALWISRFKVPEWARGLMPVVVIPLGATLIAGGIMFMVLGAPLAAITTGLESWLSGLTGTSALLLGAVLGLMMAFDMGGPVNKAAYTFAAAGLGAAATATGGDSGPLVIMAAVMAAGMTPPLGLALATVLRPSVFTPAEQQNGKAAWLLGASFITEGAIPFAAADPIRVIPPIMLGSAVTGAIVAVTSTTLRAPHGGIFVLFAIEGVVWFLVALVIGTVITAAGVIFAKSLGREGAVTA
ncbi:PTS fructose transporter subunit IIABC [Salsipaludibacter albus]|uniref:PTS fructose transporter subunit IIABC n=1 Tax=Salsipaludibacter albus TaxID=2849650 RepID=UPI001EE4C84D|nr:fructose-specific PTS transporter subunit EIIC [Salsipaludibacter albus]MBY5164424.1 fructose-specific PTS transporter subunit EIIC [Salsipaludibacter albus]